MSNLTRYRVWPDGTVQEADVPAHHWKSDDYELVEALNTEDAWARAKANAPAVPQGWRFKRNADDSIGIFAPPPKPGESQRTSHAVYPGQNRDLHELLGKLADQQAATPAPAPVQGSAITGEADVWHEGSKSFYRATLLHKLTPEEVFSEPPELDAYTQPAQEAGLTDEWVECKRISELPEVDEALRLFAEGETSEDQAVAIVQTITQALRAKGGK